GKLEKRRRIEGQFREPLRKTGGLEKALCVEGTASLKIGRFGFTAPVGPARKRSKIVRPGALIDAEGLVRPFRDDGKIRHFVIAAAQALAIQDRFRMDSLKPRWVAGEFDLERRFIP